MEYMQRNNDKSHGNKSEIIFLLMLKMTGSGEVNLDEYKLQSKVTR